MEGWRPGFSSSSAINNLRDLQLVTSFLSHSHEEEGLSCKGLGSSEILSFCGKTRPQIFCCCWKLFQSTWIWQLNSLKFVFRVPLVRVWDFQVHHSVVDTHWDRSTKKRGRCLEFTFELLWMLLPGLRAGHSWFILCFPLAVWQIFG